MGRSECGGDLVPGGKQAMVKCAGLTKTYRQGKRHVVQALSGIDLAVAPAEFVAVMGPSGSGKSTLLHIVGLLDRPDDGSLTIHGEDVSHVSSSRLAAVRNRMIGFVFQSHHLIPTLTARENVMLPLRYRGTKKRWARAEAEAMLAAVGLAGRMLHRPGELSGGEQQRVAIARALVTRPALVLADEPTGELDSATGQELIQLMRRMNVEHQQTFIIVTHDREVAHACDRTITMRDGRISDIGNH